ncbi:hypothetical protein MBRA1_002173 [Malassezia brasiliensis]|uniref:Uncharacterized protein n=1 Tax=Malassezia brasiliensis TaxID=1821822 RepID=A0AAF0DSS5_9BASI|nr:hypothetical protein MBRA1_002173 [Malassezia brasiliensis]
MHAGHRQAALFQPPPAYMDGDDYVYTHGIPAPSYLTPHTNPLDPHAVNPKVLADQRRIHVRRLYDLLQLMLLRRDARRAARCLKLLMNAPEWRPVELWKLGLEVASMSETETLAPLRYLQYIARKRTVLDAMEETNSVIASFPYRHNPQLHTYLGLLTLYLGTLTAAPDTPDTPGPSLHVPMNVVACVPDSVRRTAQLHFENAVKVAEKYTDLQNYAFRHRMRMQEQRLAKLTRLAKTHREQMWRSMRDSGWVFGDVEAPMETIATHATHPSQASPSSQNEAGSDSEDEMRLPLASYFSLESEVESGFDSVSPPPFDGVPEGPDAPPTETRAMTPEVDHDTLPPTPPADLRTLPSLQIASVQWSLHVSKLYLDLLAQAAAHAPRVVRRGDKRRP